MDEMNKNAVAVENADAAQNSAPPKQDKKPDPIKAYNELKEGTLRLFDPFEVSEKVYEELPYSFCKLTGDEYVAAMDCEKAVTFRITNNQALSLFCYAASKMTGLSPETVRENLTMMDASRAIAKATAFFIISGQAAAKATSKK